MSKETKMQNNSIKAQKPIIGLNSPCPLLKRKAGYLKLAGHLSSSSSATPITNITSSNISVESISFTEEKTIVEITSPELKRKLTYLEIGVFLPIEHDCDYYLYLCVEKGRYIRYQVNESTFIEMKNFEEQVYYSNRKYKENTRSQETHVKEIEASSMVALNHYAPGNEGYMDMLNSIKELTKEEQKIIKMRIDGFMIEEITDELSIPPATIKRRLRASRKQLSGKIKV